MQFSHDISEQRVPHTKVRTESTQSFIQDVIWGGGGRNIAGGWGVQLPDAKGICIIGQLLLLSFFDDS